MKLSIMDNWRHIGTAMLAMALAACSATDDEHELATGAPVSAQLVLSLSGQSHVSRMTDATVQEGAESDLQKFRGIRDLVLIPFATTSGAAAPVTSSDQRNGTANIALDITAAAPAQSEAYLKTLYDNSNAVVFTNADIPNGTTALLFYGQAPDAADASETVAAFVNGSIAKEGLDAGAPAGITFTPVATNTAATLPADSKAAALARYLTTIYQAWTPATGTPDPDIQRLKDDFTKNTAGSSANIRAMLQILYETLDGKTTADAAAIRTAILTGCTVSDGTLTLNADLSGYPRDINVPDGAAYVKWNAGEQKFEALDRAYNTGLANPPLTGYAFPAPLCYRANSRIHTSQASHADQIPGRNSWGATTTSPVLGLYETANGTVGAGVASVAMTDQAQYAVARFDVTVKADDAMLKDANGNDVPTGEGMFPVTGILVAGQRQVDFEWKPVGTTTPEYTVYDRHIASGMQLTTTQSLPNHTLLLQSKPGEKVKVAIEIENRSRDFYGIGPDPTKADPLAQPVKMLIPYGCRFYLIAELDLNDATGTPNNQAFTQDYTTTAHFTASSLEHAYHVVPDLRAPKLELGLSVDLNWQRGIVVPRVTIE